MFLVPDKTTAKEIQLDGSDAIVDLNMSNDLTVQSVGGVCSLVRLSGFPANLGVYQDPETGLAKFNTNPMPLKTFVQYAQEAYKGKYFKQAGYQLSKDSAVMAVITSSQTSSWRLFNEDPFMQKLWTKFHVVSYPKYMHQIAYFICTGQQFWDAFVADKPEALVAAELAEIPDAAVINAVKETPVAVATA